jgi:hypothetical protein
MATSRGSRPAEKSSRARRHSRSRGFAASVRQRLRRLLENFAGLAGLRGHRTPLHSAGREPTRRQRNAAALTSKLPNVRDEKKLIENALEMADQLTIPDTVLSYLYRRSRWQSASREEWLRDVRTACAIDSILRTIFTRRRPGNFSHLVDGANQLQSLPEGTLLLTFHGAFVRIARQLFADVFPSGVQVDRAGLGDAGGNLFNALRSLQDGHHVLIAPDGPGGKAVSQIRVFDFTVPVAGGAAFLAHASGCQTAWYSLVRKGEHFAVQIDLGPKCRADESYAAFEQRLAQFYGSRIEAAFSGDPRSLSLSRRWQSAFKRASRRDESKNAS